MSEQPTTREPTTAQLFEHLRELLVDVLGTAATATFLRRAARRASIEFPELGALEITKQRLDYEYALPPQWSDGRDGLAALTALSSHLEKLLFDLTGPVMVRRLRAAPLLGSAGLFPGQEISS